MKPYSNPTTRRFSEDVRAVAKLASEGIYVCSERSLRRILKARRLDTYRQRSKPAQCRHRPRQYAAHEPLRVLSWDITYLRSATVRGGFFYLYLFLDIWSRRIVGAEVHEAQRPELARALLSKVCRENAVDTEQLVVHADNGGPMKGATMLATMQFLGITPSFKHANVVLTLRRRPDDCCLGGTPEYRRAVARLV